MRKGSTEERGRGEQKGEKGKRVEDKDGEGRKSAGRAEGRRKGGGGKAD